MDVGAGTEALKFYLFCINFELTIFTSQTLHFKTFVSVNVDIAVPSLYGSADDLKNPQIRTAIPKCMLLASWSSSIEVMRRLNQLVRLNFDLAKSFSRSLSVAEEIGEEEEAYDKIVALHSLFRGLSGYCGTSKKQQ